MIENKTENNMSSSCLTRRSRNKDLRADWIPDQVGDDRGMGASMTSARGETGRSMVEMLGTLAIIGVLSVGGIAGYTYAMNKHYANELLNGASQRAVILKAQKAAGLPLSLREFDGVEVAGGTFESAEELEDGSAFIIPVSGVKGAVCENLIEATEGTDIAIAKDDGETLTDITEENCDDDNLNKLVFVFETGIGGGETPKVPCSNDDNCPGDQICQDGSCSCPEDMWGGVGIPSDTDSSVCCKDNRSFGIDYMHGYPYYNGFNFNACGCPDEFLSETVPGVCCYNGYAYSSDNNTPIANPDVCGCPADWNVIDGECVEPCTSHENCDDDEYCQFGPEMGDEACETIQKGLCQSLPTGKSYGEFWMLEDTNDWWTAKDICEAKGMVMVSLTDLNCVDGRCADAQVIGSQLYLNESWTIDPDYSCANRTIALDSGDVYSLPRSLSAGILCRDL